MALEAAVVIVTGVHNRSAIQPSSSGVAVHPPG